MSRGSYCGLGTRKEKKSFGQCDSVLCCFWCSKWSDKSGGLCDGCTFLSEGWEWKICDLRCKKSGVTMKKSPLECAHLNTILIPIFNVRGEPRRVVKKCSECGKILETESIGR